MLLFCHFLNEREWGNVLEFNIYICFSHKQFSMLTVESQIRWGLLALIRMLSALRWVLSAISQVWKISRTPASLSPDLLSS